MAIAPSDGKDRFGIDPEAAGMYGAQTALEMQQRSLKQYNPAAAQFSTVNPNTAPGPKKPVAPKGPVAPLTSSPQKPGSAVSQPQEQTGQPQKGFGPSSGLGQAPGQSPQGSGARGMGPTAGLVPVDQEARANQPLPPTPNAWATRSMSDAFKQLAALPNPSPVLQLYARLAAQKDKQPQ